MKITPARIAMLALVLAPLSSACAQTFKPGQSITDANPQPVKALCWNGTTFAACSTSGGGSSGADVGTPGTTAPTSASQTAGKTSSGNLVATCVDNNGKACVPVAGVADRVITKTNLAADTSTVICPAAANPVTVEIQISGAGLGLGLNGQTLTSPILGTTTTSADVQLPNALSTYVQPVASTNAITARSATAQIVTCVQTLRQ